jgi:hypothetical protein
MRVMATGEIKANTCHEGGGSVADIGLYEIRQELPELTVVIIVVE